MDPITKGRSTKGHNAWEVWTLGLEMRGGLDGSDTIKEHLNGLDLPGGGLGG